MRELVFLLEEDSAKALLESLLPRLLADDYPCRLIAFEGKQDLEKQMIKRIRGYQNPEARFIVLRDQDSYPDCKKVKATLMRRCRESGKAAHCLVRIACTELETFYLADLEAVEAALEMKGLVRHQAARKFRTPDALASPSKELRTITGNRYEKVSGSRAIGSHLKLQNDRSPSFRNLISGIQRMASA